MDVVAFAIVLVALAAFVALPLYRRRPADEPTREPDVGAFVDALRQLERDHADGLVDPETYARERATLEAEALRTIAGD